MPKKLWTAPEVVQTVLNIKQLIFFSMQIVYLSFNTVTHHVYMYYVIAVYYVCL